ncbi:MAG: DUF6339 family protein [Clostridiales bacterium]|uniref:DUF6339 family protein n=1 Tax=Peptostreptococcaceae TaxID=186804 RepID=UPI002A541547|nr:MULTISPECIES: DUF6339 family protein [Peptostreptococcaceae]MDD7756151.1 DUF6339 family protein [Clostridiales bacterium]MDY4137159.1 DUF6339 family protein [Terrisporobacter sp.]MDY5212360.1 DUF6339 family protein [Intestinibacter sp.]
MKLKILTDEMLTDLKGNFESYKHHYKDETNNWFLQHFNQNNGLIESKIECNDFILNTDDDYNISDYENIKILYSNLKHLSNSHAADERFWSGLLHTQFWYYAKYRRKEEIENNKDQDIKNSFFFTRGAKRSAHINCLSRLWWAGNLTYDETREDPFELTKLICDNAFASTIMLLSSSNLTANKDNILGILSSIQKRKLKGEEIKREHFVSSTKYLNAMGSVTILDFLNRHDIEKRIDKLFNEKFGVL